MKFDLKRRQILNLVFHLYFLNSDISLIIELTVIECYTDVKDIHIGRTVSQHSYVGLSFFYFI